MEANGLAMDAISNETVDLNLGPDYHDFVGIFLLLIINSTISFIEENNAGNAAAALMARLAPKAKVLRDGTWSELDASLLVPGDIISIKLGDIIPADARLLEGDPLKIDQSALTGESLPVTKNPGDGIYSGSTSHLVESTTHVGHFQKVLTSIGNFCICSIAAGMTIELIVMYAVHERKYRQIIDNLLVLLIGGIPIAMPTVLSVTMAIGSHKLAQQGAITKRMTAIEEMAGMDVLCSDKTGTLTLNKLSVDKTLIEVFARGIEKDDVILMAARASRLENQDAIDFAIVSMLPDPKEARAGIQEVHFLPFNPTDKRTALTYLDAGGKMHRVSKGAPEQEVPEGTKESPGGPWQFIGLLPLFDPPRHDSAETIRRALDLGVSVKMITGDQLAIAKETGRRLGMGTNMYPSSSLLGNKKEGDIAVLPVDELIEQADGFAGVFPEHKYEIVQRLQARKHICGMTGDGVNDAPALKIADIGIAVADATDAARGASDIVLTEPGLSVIISAVLTSRGNFPKNEELYSYKTDFFANLFKVDTLNIDKIKDKRNMQLVAENSEKLASAVYLQVSTISQALIFVTRSRGWSFLERPGLLLMGAFVTAQLIATVLAAIVNWKVAGIRGIGWGWTGVIWVYNIVIYLFLDPIKFAVRYGLTGKAWNLVIDRKVAFTNRKDFGREARAAAWAHEQRTLHGLESAGAGRERAAASVELRQMAEDARRRAEIARLRELHTLKGKVESVVKLKGLDLEDINNQHYTV
ncbi:hypothetical protein PR202_ga27413 [Eleusine coracana subsp. coracana]|uniref:P-type ATPase A domain-containing protein n=1 Tax=Eleusine coracana subsp. coracana TaxID=191504 RepID=A0AAV5DG16_ELECO|nr:hypothetical protein PR202_ga27413 [Eleusine coracana subsp. coracana]